MAGILFRFTECNECLNLTTKRNNANFDVLQDCDHANTLKVQ
jgi:hypothetical protein